MAKVDQEIQASYISISTLNGGCIMSRLTEMLKYKPRPQAYGRLSFGISRAINLSQDDIRCGSQAACSRASEGQITLQFRVIPSWPFPVSGSSDNSL